MIEYCAVYRDGKVVSQARGSGADFSEHEWSQMNALLSKIPSYDSRYTYKSGDRFYHYIMENSTACLCIADTKFPQRIAFAFLEEVHKKFMSASASSKRSPFARDVSSAFAPVILEVMRKHNSLEVDKITRVRRQIDDVKQVMLENIDAVIRRGEDIDTLVDRTSELSSNADNFKARSRTLQRKVVWQNIKTLMVLVLCFVVLCTIFGMMICDIDFRRCR